MTVVGVYFDDTLVTASLSVLVQVCFLSTNTLSIKDLEEVCKFLGIYNEQEVRDEYA